MHHFTEMWSPHFCEMIFFETVLLVFFMGSSDSEFELLWLIVPTDEICTELRGVFLLIFYINILLFFFIDF